MMGGMAQSVAFPASLPPLLAAAMGQHGQIVALPAGARVYAPGKAPEAYLLVLDGSVRVQQVSENGREIVLYRVRAGESCTLTTACLLGDDRYTAEAITETAVRAVALPRSAFDALVAGSPEFRRFVFSTLSDRITNLFRLVGQVAFGRLDGRIAQRLLDLAAGAGAVRITQQQLAAEVGSAREVISRMLGQMQRQGLVRVRRGAIDILDAARLAGLIEQGAEL
jgi:CRP/FNR family transcriptional regulator